MKSFLVGLCSFLIVSSVLAGQSGPSNILENGINGLRIGATKSDLLNHPQIGPRLKLSTPCYGTSIYPGDTICPLISENFYVAGQKVRGISLNFNNEILYQVGLTLYGGDSDFRTPEIYALLIGMFSASTGHAPESMESSAGEYAFYWSNGANVLQAHYVTESKDRYRIFVNIFNIETMSRRVKNLRQWKSSAPPDGL